MTSIQPAEIPQDLPVLPFKPFEDRVVLLPLDPESVTQGGIVIPDTAKDKPVRGVVLAAGPGKSRDTPLDTQTLRESGAPRALRHRHPMPVKRGDVVVYPMWAGDKLPQLPGQKELRILRSGEILGIEVNRETEGPMDLIDSKLVAREILAHQAEEVNS